MIKKLGFLVKLTLFLLIIGLGAVAYKYDEYLRQVATGSIEFQNESIRLDSKLLKPKKLFDSPKIETIKNFPLAGFNRFNFLGLEFALPVENPMYYAIPNFSPEIKREHFSFLIMNPRDKQVGKLTFLGIYTLKNLFHQKMMLFPLFENYYVKLSYADRIKNLFGLKLDEIGYGPDGFARSVVTSLDRLSNFDKDIIQFGRVGRKLKNVYYLQVDSINKDLKKYYIIKEFFGKSFIFSIEYSLIEENYENVMFKIVQMINLIEAKKDLHVQYYSKFKDLKRGNARAALQAMNLYASLINRFRKNEEMYMNDFNLLLNKELIDKEILENFYLYNLLNFKKSFATSTDYEFSNDKLNLYLRDEISSRRAAQEVNVFDETLKGSPPRDLNQEHLDDLKKKKMKRERNKTFID